MIGIKCFAFIQAKRFRNILIGMCMDGFFKSLAQKILAAFGRGDMAVGAEHNIVGRQRIRGHKKPRLRLTIRRSSSVKPYGFFHSAISRDILISCGIQWFAQPARYFSHAHLYLNGTSWLTSVLPLMMRLSATLMRAGVCSSCFSFKVCA